LNIAHTTYIVGQQEPLLMMGQFGQPYGENDMVYIYTHDPSMFDHFDLPTITFQKVKLFAHKKKII
jgi:hypothetical protein